MLFKRAADVLISILFFLMFSWWLFTIIALAILIDSRGPVFYNKLRYGKNRKKFICYKFRTMIKGDYSLINKKYNEVSADSKLITRVGKFLRRTSIDELPQFINIFRGEMSLVGPRPQPVALDDEMAKKIPGYFARYKVRPGLTGWAQVNGLVGPANHPDSMKKRLGLDLYYARNQSVWLDIKIILLTAGSILKR